ncbi:MAG: hypothetical protein ABI947_04195 [Chloroflexota bacterium]
MRRFLLLSVVLVFIAGCSSGNAAPAATGGAGTTPVASIVPTIDPNSLGSPRVLAWNPNTLQLGWYVNGKQAPIGQPSTGKALAIPCGMQPNGEKLAIFQGTDPLQPYLLTINSSAAVPLENTTGLSCALPGRTQFSPDGNRLGLIKYTTKTFDSAYATGTLQIVKLPEATEQTSLDNVAAFDLQNDGAVVVQLFPNTKNQAKSADVIFWDGSKTRKIDENVGVLNPDTKADCEFVAAKVLHVGDKVYELFGEKCKIGGSSWRIRKADFGGGNGAEVQSGKTGTNGAATYFSSSAMNEMLLLPDNKTILFTVPNGTASDLVNVARLSIADGSVNNVIGLVTTDQYPPKGQSSLLRSPKNNYLTLVTRNGDGIEQLYLYDFNAPDKAPGSVAGGGKLDQVNDVAWSGDGQKLFYTMVGNTQALFVYDLKGKSNIAARGTFAGGLAVNNDGSQASTVETNKVASNDVRYNLVLINTSDGSKINLVEGAKGDKALMPILVR